MSCSSKDPVYYYTAPTDTDGADLSCVLCSWFKGGLGTPGGSCRKLPPLPGASWPRVTIHDWCGEYQEATDAGNRVGWFREKDESRKAAVDHPAVLPREPRAGEAAGGVGADRDGGVPWDSD